MKLWLWKNFVDGKPEYWAFDNPFPVHMDCGDPQTLGEPCGYALLKPSRTGRTDVTDEQVLLRIKTAREFAKPLNDELMDCVDRLGSQWREVDPRVWDHLLIYAPADKIAARAAQLQERNTDDGR